MQSHKSLLNPTDLVSYIPQHTLHHLIIVINPVVVALPNAANPLTTCSFLQCDKKRKPNPLAATSTSSGIFRPQLLSTIQSVFFFSVQFIFCFYPQFLLPLLCSSKWLINMIRFGMPLDRVI